MTQIAADPVAEMFRNMGSAPPAPDPIAEMFRSLSPPIWGAPSSGGASLSNSPVEPRPYPEGSLLADARFPAQDFHGTPVGYRDTGFKVPGGARGLERVTLPEEALAQQQDKQAQDQIVSEAGPAARFGATVIAGARGAAQTASANWQSIAKGPLAYVTGADHPVKPDDVQTFGKPGVYEQIASRATPVEQVIGGLYTMPVALLEPESIAAALLTRTPGAAVMENPATQAVLGLLGRRSPAVAAATEQLLTGATHGAAFGGIHGTLTGKDEAGTLKEAAEMGALGAGFALPGAVMGGLAGLRTREISVVEPGATSASERGAGVAINDQGGIETPAAPAMPSPETGRTVSQTPTSTESAGEPQTIKLGGTDHFAQAEAYVNSPEGQAEIARKSKIGLTTEDSPPETARAQENTNAEVQSPEPLPPRQDAQADVRPGEVREPAGPRQRAEEEGSPVRGQGEEAGGVSVGETTGIAHRVTESRGTDAARGEGIGAEESVERGRTLLKGGTDPQAVVADFEKSGAVSGDAMSVVRAHAEELSRAANKAADTHGADSPEYKAAFKAETDWIKRAKPMQTEWHKIGQAQQGETDIDTGTFHGMRRAFYEATGRDPTALQESRIRSHVRVVKHAAEATDAARTALYDTLDKHEPHVRALADRIVSRVSKAADAARARIKARGVRLRAGIDPAEIADYAIIGAEYIAKGTAKFAEWSGKMVAEFGDAIKPHLQAIFDASDKELDKHVPSGSRRPSKEPVDIAGHVPGTTMDPARAKALWDEAKANYIEKGVTGFDDIVHGLATDHGLPVADIRRGLAQPNGAKRLTDAMYAKQAESRRVSDDAKRWVANAAKPRWQRVAEATPRAFFSFKVFGHGTVGMVTHAGNQLFNPAATGLWLRNFARQFKLMGVHDQGAFHEHAMADLERRPNYTTARRAGLGNDPHHYADDFQRGAVTKWLSKVGLTGNRGFDALKLFRQDVFDKQWDGLPASLKTPDMAKMLADQINHATGYVRSRMGGSAGATILFAPKLEVSRWAFLIGDPAKAAKTFADWRNATPEAKAMATREVKQKAMIAGTYFGALAINQGILLATESGQSINYTDPTKPDFLAFKVAGHDVGIVSPMIGTVRFLWNLGAASVGPRKNLKGDSRAEKMYQVGGEYLRSKASPFMKVVADVVTQSDYKQQPMPFSSDPVPKRLRARGYGKIGYGEYAAETVLPIPAEEAMKEAWKGQGASDESITKWLKAIAVGGIAGATGIRINDELPPKR